MRDLEKTSRDGNGAADGIKYRQPLSNDDEEGKRNVRLE
jgi:hypothetical protein